MTNKNQLSAITGFHSAFLKVKTSDVGNMDAGMMMKTEKMNTHLQRTREPQLRNTTGHRTK